MDPVPHNTTPPEPVLSCRSSERTVYERVPTKYELLWYTTVLVPWSTSLAFLYGLVSVVPILLLAIIRRDNDAILSVSRRIYRLHERYLHLTLPQSNLRLFAMQMLSPFVALVICIGGVLAGISQLYSLVLGDDEATTTMLDYTMGLWYSWMHLYCTEPTKAEDMV